MSTDHLARLEEKIQQVVDTVSLQRMEIEELREEKARLEEENNILKEEMGQWSQRVGSILGKLDAMAEETEAEEA
ncbi:cell division protein ZapB [Endozoicomonas sp. SM1973]|uniref:Cell division protein ZapB n=2 Tax=Spartinivicinus TaxID=2768738 RepID=A0A853I3P9_9GAMM|nr:MULTISPECIES: cell division protein ZapB [Spartinivicinus]MCX4029952.1 cell division protein ZapB [Spartinivicinus marinus]MDE1463889.1 cell division protein ZapB [Spartinivicinus sp. A2-2]NYZ64804.1 cell division protein ZapB [Spartinivicinus marinus]